MFPQPCHPSSKWMRNATRCGDNGNLISGIESARKGAARIDILTGGQKARHEAWGTRRAMFAGWFQVHDQNEPQQASAVSNKNKQKVRQKPTQSLHRSLLNWSPGCYRKIQSKRNENQADRRQLWLSSLLSAHSLHTQRVRERGRERGRGS